MAIASAEDYRARRLFAPMTATILRRLGAATTNERHRVVTLPRRCRFLVLAACLWTAGPTLLAAQEAATAARPGPWVPIGSRLDGLVTWLIGEGALPGVDPLSRPYRLALVREAVDAQDNASGSRAGRRALRWLQADLA